MAVVTGGAQGIGLAIAKRLVASGAKVSLWDMNEELLRTASAEIGAAGIQTVNVTDVAGLEAALAKTEAEVGPVSILVHSAGIAGPNHSLDAYPVDDWRRVIEIDLNGAFYVNELVVPGMKARNYGRIVNIASIAGKEGNPNAAAYAAAKGGVIAMTKALGQGTGQIRYRRQHHHPGDGQDAHSRRVTPEFVQYMLSRIPRGRFLEVEEAANMVAWLVSRENSFTTASVFDLSGGRATY